MNTATKVLVLLQDQKAISANLIKKTLKVCAQDPEQETNKALNQLKRAKAVQETDDLCRITGNGLKRLPRIKEKLEYNLPYWLGSWTMFIFEISEKEKNKRDQLRYRLKKEGYGMIQSSIWIAPRPVSKDLKAFIKTQKLEENIKVFRFTLAKEDLKQFLNQAWSIDELENEYKKFVEQAKTLFKKVKQHNWESNRIKKRALKVLAEQFKQQYFSLRIKDPELPKSVLPNDWQGYRAFHIYEQLDKYL